MTRHFALVGEAIGDSPSPQMHNAAFNALKINARYDLRPSSFGEFSDVCAELELGILDGINVTAPFKVLAASRFVPSDRVERGGSANTIYRVDGGLLAESTDIAGVYEPLRRRGLQGGEGLVLGSGGAARAASLALEGLGVTVHVAARRAEAARELLEAVAPKPRGQALTLSELERDQPMLRSLRVVVQATSVGAHGEVMEFPWNAVSRDAIAFELVYRRTPFLRNARTRGLAVVTGDEMLLEQGMRSFALWTGVAAPRDVMQTALRHTLGVLNP